MDDKLIKMFEEDDELTICSTMHCYNPVKMSKDPARPPFCESCKAKKEENSRVSGG